VIDFGTADIVKLNKMLNKKIGTPYYIAPEVLNNNYNHKCDIWSCGVIMYILLVGSPPFSGDNDNEIYKAVKEGKVNLEGEDWDNITPDAKDLIKKLLKKDMNKRCSAEQALGHVWFKKMKDKNSFNNISEKALKNIILNLEKFNTDNKLQQATLAFIVHNLIKKEEIVDIRNAFIEFDENGDGRLSKEELVKALSKIIPSDKAKSESERLMKVIDVDKNGCIEYKVGK
jgi:calcium-dependent protein kinase